MVGGGLLERLLHRPAGGVVDMDDAAVAVAALAGQVPAIAVGRALNGTPSSASRSIAAGALLDDELDRGAVVEAGARRHRVLDMAFERVAGLEHCRRYGC